MSMTAALRELTEAFSALVSQHLAVARLELEEDAKYVGARVGLIAGLAPLILVGYGFVCAALAMALALVMPMPVAVLLVGVLNIAAGAWGIRAAVQQLQARRVMTETVVGAEATVAMVRQEAKAP